MKALFLDWPKNISHFNLKEIFFFSVYDQFHWYYRHKQSPTLSGHRNELQHLS